MQRFSARDAKYAYSSEHASIGTVQPGERFEVESVEGFSGYFRTPSDFTPEVYAEAEAHKWAVTGPISVAGARANGAGAVTIHDVDVVTPGVVVYGGYTATDPLEWWDDQIGCDVFPVEQGVLRFDERTSLPTRPLIGCLAVAPEEGTVHAKLQSRYGGQRNFLERRQRARVVLPVVNEGGGAYFCGCKGLGGGGVIGGVNEQRRAGLAG